MFDFTHTCDHEKRAVTLPQGVLFGRFGSLRLAIHTCLICTSLRCRACGHAGQLATRAYICGGMCCGVACLTQRGHGWFVRSASTVCICGAVGHTLRAAVLAGRHLWGPFVCGDASQTDIHTYMRAALCTMGLASVGQLVLWLPLGCSKGTDTGGHLW